MAIVVKFETSRDTRPESGKFFFGCALGDFFPSDCTVSRRQISAEEVKALIMAQGIEFCCDDRFHKATIEAMLESLRITPLGDSIWSKVAITESTRQLPLDCGDSVIVLRVFNLQPLDDHNGYHWHEINSATFTFSVYTVIE